MTFSGICLCLSVLILSLGYSAVAVSCDSSLRNLFPHLFTHCNNPAPCGYGPWGRWFYTGVLKNDSRCDSGKVRQQNRTRAASTPACESQIRPEKQARYECISCTYEPWRKWFHTGVLKNDSRCDSGKARQQIRTRAPSTTACESQLPPESQEKYECIPCTYGPWGRWFPTGVLRNDLRCKSGKVRQYNRTKTASTPACESQLQPEKQERYDCMLCADGSWGRWVYTGVLKKASRCASGQVRQHRRSKVAPSSACQNTFQPSEDKYECEPTLLQKAILFINNLRLGADAEDQITDPFVTDPPPFENTNTPTRTSLPPATRPPTARPPATRPPATRPPTARPPTIRPPATRPEAIRPPAPRPARPLPTRQPSFFMCRLNSTATATPGYPRDYNTINPLLNLRPDPNGYSTLSPTLCYRQRRSSKDEWLSRRSRQAPTRGYCPTTAQQPFNRVCRNIGCDPPSGKRSIIDMFIQGAQRPESADIPKGPVQTNKLLQDHQPLEQLDPSIPVEEFDLEKYVNIIHDNRKKRQIKCTNDTHNATVRYVLFIVDTSGSISKADFDAVKEIVANISDALCDHLKFALLTYSNYIHLEFCFNCSNDRRNIRSAILRSGYRGGLTHTTDAIKCACEQILTQQCGLPEGIHTPNIDVVLLTDGNHNGPCRSRLGATVKCLHNRENINTFGIGIGSIDYESVRALTNGEGANIFRVEDFPQLHQLFTLIQNLLATKDENGDPVYRCAAHDGSPCKH